MTNTTRMLAAALLAVIGAGCRGKTDEPVVTTNAQGGATVSPSGTEAAKEGKSMVRVLSALPTPKAVEVTGDDRTLFSDVHYKDVTPYAEVKDNLIALRVLAGGGKPVADNHEMLRDGNRYTAIVLPDEKGGTQLKVIHDDVQPADGKARLRVINASPTVKDADVAVLGESKPIFSGVDFASAEGYKDANPVTITLDVRQDKDHVKPMILKPLHLEAGKAYTIVITGGKGAPVEAFTFEDAVTPPSSLSGS